jgi:hypothetical protein
VRPVLFLLLLALSTVCLARAEEPRTITTLSGERFDNATVTGASVYGLSITHSGGVSFVRFENLSEDLRKQYGYDPARVAAADAGLDEFEIRVQDIPAVFARAKAQAKDESFAVFVFEPPGGSLSKDAINIQFSFENGRIGLDWVLLSPPNIKDREQYERLATSLGYKIIAKEKDGVKYLRIEEGDLPHLCEKAICDLYSLRKESKVGLLVHRMSWP